MEEEKEMEEEEEEEEETEEEEKEEKEEEEEEKTFRIMCVVQCERRRSIRSSLIFTQILQCIESSKRMIKIRICFIYRVFNRDF